MGVIKSLPFKMFVFFNIIMGTVLSVLFKSKFVMSLFTNCTLFIVATFLLYYRMQFRLKKDFVNSANDKSEPDAIILTGAKLQTGQEQDEKEERFLRVSSVSNKLNKKISIIIFSIVSYLLCFTINQGEINYMNFFVLATSASMILIAESIGQLLMAPTIMVIFFGFLFPDSIRPQILTITFFFSFFASLMTYSFFEREISSISFKYLKILFRSFLIFYLFWAIYSQIISKDQEIKKSVEASIEKINRKSAFKNQRNRIAPGDLNMAIGALDEMNKRWRSSEKVNLPEFSLFNNKYREINQQAYSVMESLNLKAEWNEEDLQSYHQALHQAREIKMSFENINIVLQNDSLPTAPQFMPPITESSGLLHESMKIQANYNNDLMLEHLRKINIDTENYNQIANEIKSMQREINELQMNTEIENYLRKQSQIADDITRLSGQEIRSFKNLEEDLLNQKEALFISSNQELQKYQQSNISRDEIISNIESFNHQNIEEQSKYFSQDAISKSLERMYKFIKGLLIFVGIFFIYELLKGKAKKLRPEKEERKQLEKILRKRHNYLSSEEEVRSLYKNFNSALHFHQYKKDEEVPPPKIMQGEKSLFFAKKLKSLKTIVEIFSRCHYGEFKVTKSEFIEFRKAYKRLCKQLL